MAETARVAAAAEGNGHVDESGPPSPPSRAIRPRRSLPGSRAVVGGFLIAAAAVGVFAAHARATAVPTTAYVVAASDLAPGDTIDDHEVATIRLHLPAALTQTAVFTDRQRLVGATVLGPIGEGELIQASSVVRRSSRSAAELSFAIDPARAVGGAIRPGERVDVIATFGSGGDTYSSVVVRAAQVVALRGGGAGLADPRALTITLAVTSTEEALALAHAVDAAKVTIVRAGGEPSAPSTYRPPSQS